MTGLRRALWAIAGAGGLILAIQIVLIGSAEFAPDRGLWIALDIVAGGGFVGVGLFAWWRRPDNRVGALMVATGFTWFLGMFGLTEPAFLFTIGILFNNLFLGPAIQLLLGFPTGRLESRFDRQLTLAAYLAVSVAYLPLILTFDPSAKTGCGGCPDNVFLIQSSPDFASVWGDALSVLGVAILLGVVVRLVGRWRRATPPMRRVVTPQFIAGALLMVMLTVLLIVDLGGVELSNTVYYIALLPFAAVPYLFLGSLIQARMFRGGAVSELVATIGGPLRDDELRAALARALNDPSLELAYWLPESGSYVDPDGERIELPDDDSGRSVYHVMLDGERVAALIHDPLLLDEPELVEAVGAAATLALERERLDAELRAKVGELRESRARLISIGLAERRRLERDLHDGAQQRLVSLALDLRLARAATRDEPERAEELLDGAGEELERALGELRELARGLHPAVLSDRGLDTAIDALASRAPLQVDVVERLGERVAEPVELAAYFVVSEALTNVAKYAQASHAEVRLGRENGRVLVQVADDGIGGADAERGTGLRGLADRVVALGGRFEVASRRGEGTTVKARIPCE
jgi:signal transduction histidine kinase